MPHEMYKSATVHPTPDEMSVKAYPAGSPAESVPLDVRRTYFAAGVAAERARMSDVLMGLGDWLFCRLREVVSTMK